jgi:TPR repeat protein
MSRMAPSPEQIETTLLEAITLHERGHYEAAVEKYLICARAGDVTAQGNVATILDSFVTPVRDAEAVYWYKRALRNGSVTAAWNLAMHHKAKGNTRWHAYWLGVAADRGDEDAAEELRELKRG